MIYKLINLIIFLKCFHLPFLIVVSIDSSLNTENNVGNDDDDNVKDFYRDADKSNWIDYGDMFPTIMKDSGGFKEAAFKVIEQVKERKQRQVNGDEKNCHSDCDDLRIKLRNCELSQNNPYYHCPIDDLCAKRGYQIVRRLAILLNKKLKESYSAGSVLQLTVNLDEFTLEMPTNLNNASDCEYLTNIHPILDQVLRSLTIYNTDPVIYSEYLSLKAGVTGLLGILLVISLLRMHWKLRLIAFFIICFFVVLIWEYLNLYQIEVAKLEEKLNRLKGKCESQDQNSWFTWTSSIGAMITKQFTFGSQISECTDYHISTRVNPLLAVNPILAFSKLFERTFLYAMRLTANATGDSIAIFFSHIPSFWIPFFIAAGVILIIYALKYSIKYRNPKPRKQKNAKPKQQSIREVERLPIISNRTKSKVSKADPRLNKSSIEFPISRYGSTGDIQNLSM